MNITCANGEICSGKETYKEQCDVFYGPNCKYPCDLSNCEENIELDTMCWEYDCAPAPPAPANHLAAEITLPVIGLICLILLIMCCWWRRKRQEAPQTPIIRNSIYRETTTQRTRVQSLWERMKCCGKRDDEEPLLNNVATHVENCFSLSDDSDETHNEVSPDSPAVLGHR